MTSPDDVPKDVPKDVPRDGAGDTDAPGEKPGTGAPEGPAGPVARFDPSVDEDAAWRLIVENYGERPQLDDTSVDPDPTGPAPAAVQGAGDSGSSVEDPHPGPTDQPRHQPPDQPHDRRNTDDEHFVPPEPPPVPRGTPARRLAWAGLFAFPLLMILAVVFRWSFPAWLSMLLIGAFVGGFVFLVATMPRDTGDGWGDGAVV